ncbi:MAG: PorP/SprF family type IX secretion system membrane protein, partial [Bacteroidota bacterium]
MKNFNINNKIATIIGLMLLMCTQTYAQQDPQFTQYMYNMSVINPAYATAEQDILNIGGLYRSQWVGVEGAPETATFFAHAPVSERVELGISFVNDRIGNVVNENNVYADFAYVLPVGLESKLSLGVKAGFTFFNTDFSGFNLQSGNVSTDIAFNENINQTFPNVGAGVFYFTNKYYIGLSAPN